MEKTEAESVEDMAAARRRDPVTVRGTVLRKGMLKMR